ncbi:MAG: hypothetical protein K8T10_17665 [Candidatus Eremiobacteraeota bacterium]|nr:hypothetical protein [Candidatus Eremiobacteraeota bacterium]
MFRRANTRGSILVLSIMLFLLLLTIAASLISQEAITRRMFLRSRIEGIESRAMKKALLELKGKIEIAGKNPISDFEVRSNEDSDFKVNVKVVSFNPPQGEEAKDFAQIPEVGYSKSLTVKVDDRDIKVPPWHNLAVLESPLGNKYIAMYSYAFPYGAYAPNGKIDLYDARSWANPTLKQVEQILQDKDKKQEYDRNKGDVYSGTPVDILARKDINITTFPHGRAYSYEGKIAVKGGGMGFSKFTTIPATDYYNKYVRNFSNKIESRVVSSKNTVLGNPLNKEDYIFSRVTPPLTPLSIVNGVGGDVTKIFNLQQAADSGMLFPIPTIPVVSMQSYMSFGTLLTFQLHAPMPPSGKSEPQTRTQEASFDNSGAPKTFFFWGSTEYWRLMLGHFSYVMEILGRKIRTVHLGQGAPDVQFSSGSIDIKTTFVVPRGRTLEMPCNTTIRGDLWIQDGATLYVMRNLTVKSPGVYTSNLSIPSGRVIFGKGSTLVVDGDFSCQGNESLGSILISSPEGKINPITSALICYGNVDIPYGVLPGVSLSDLSQNLAVKNFMTTVDEISPNLAKLVGPFYSRGDIFAAKPAVFAYTQFGWVYSLIILPNTYKNANLKIFKLITTSYTTFLNASLGEYLFTQADWWSSSFGEDAVPVIHKIDMANTSNDNTITKLSAINVYGFTCDYSKVKSLINNISAGTFQNIGSVIFQEIATEIIAKISLQFISIPNIDTIVNNAFNKLYSKIFKVSPTDVTLNTTNAATFKAGMDSVYQHVRNKLNTHYNDRMVNKETVVFNEVSGLFVYSKGKLTLGGPLNCGFFIAKGNIKIDSSGRNTRVVGCMISLTGNIKGKNCQLRYYPYFTRFSLHIPEQIPGTGLTALVNDIKQVTVKTKSDYIFPEFGIEKGHFQLQGWSRWSYVDRKKQWN